MLVQSEKCMRVTVERLPNGLYRMTQEGEPVLVGCAASTAIALAHAVFKEEAKGNVGPRQASKAALD
jgi:hypothetical protein